jgi:hypothetical protein
MIRLAARQVCSGEGFRNRSAALRDFTPEVLGVFGEAFLLPSMDTRKSHVRVAIFKGLGSRLKSLYQLFKKAPQLWVKIKEVLGIENLRDIPKKLKSWAKQGMKSLKKSLKSLVVGNPLVALYFVPKNKLPGVGDLLNRVTKSSPRLDAVLSKVNKSVVQPIDQILKRSKVLRTLARPVMAAIFIFIWLNVAELSWDAEGLVKGFTGNISLGELLGSLPESGLGLLIALLFPGLGTFGLLAPTLMARIAYLLYKKILVWTKGGLVILWDKLGISKSNEFVPVI